MSLDEEVLKAIIMVNIPERGLPQPIVYHGFKDVRYHSGNTYALHPDGTHEVFKGQDYLVVDYKVKK
jgi:hypothetical protein